MINEYDEFSQSCEGDADSTYLEGLKGLSKEMELEWADQLNSYVVNMDNMHRKPAAKIDPMKETPSLNTTSYLGKRLRQAENGLPVDMRLIHQLSFISRNPISTETCSSSDLCASCKLASMDKHSLILVLLVTVLTVFLIL